MKIHLYLLPLLLFVHSNQLMAQKKQSQQTNVRLNGPIAHRACPLCPSFPCPTCNSPSTGATGSTGGICPTGTTIIPAGLICLEVTQSVTVPTITAGCAEIDNLFVGFSADIKEDMSVQADVTVGNDSCVDQNLDVGGDATITGNQVILGDLTVNSDTTINVFLAENGPALINGSLIVTGSNTIDGDLIVGGTATFAGPLSATGGLSVFQGEVLSGGLQINPTGCTGCTGAFINGNLCIIGNETITGDKFVEELTVDENATFNIVTIGVSGATGIASSLITNNTVTMNNDLTVQGGQIVNAGNVTLTSGNLFVNGATGNATFIGTVTANNGATIAGGLTVRDGAEIALGNLIVSVGNVTIDGSLTVNGSITGNGAATLASLTVTDDTNSSSPVGPAALVVNGGAGIAKDVWIGDSLYLPNPVTGATGLGYSTALDYYEESCFSTSFKWGGLTVAPATEVLIKAIRVGNIVNLLIPPIIINNPGAHIDVVSSTTAMPARFRPFTTIRGPSSTIINNIPTDEVIFVPGEPVIPVPPISGVLGEFNVSPAGIITFGFAGPTISPQPIESTDFVMVDANTITYNINGCERNCKRPTFD